MKRFLLAFVLVAALLGLLAAPAFAADPYEGWPITWMTYAAYVHPWGDPPYWEEMYWEWVVVDDPTDPAWPGYYDRIMTAWDTDTTEGPWWWDDEAQEAIPFEYKAIPSYYEVWFVAWMHGAGPRGQYEALRGGLALSGYLEDDDGETVWSTTVQEAVKLWSQAFQMPPTWTVPTPNKGEQVQWAIAWTYRQGPMDAGVYTGRGDYLIKHQMTAQYLDDPAQRGPIHIGWKGATSTFPDISLTVE